MAVIEGAWSTAAESNARTSELAEYDRMVRPSSTVNLQVGLHLLTINYLVCMTDTHSGQGIYIYDHTNRFVTKIKQLLMLSSPPLETSI